MRRPTRTTEPHRTVGTWLSVEAYEALAQAAREARTTVSDVVRRGAALAVLERGIKPPQDLGEVRGVPADPITQTIVAAPARLTVHELTRIVVALSERLEPGLTLRGVLVFAANLSIMAVDYDWDLAILPQLVAANRGRTESALSGGAAHAEP